MYTSRNQIIPLAATNSIIFRFDRLMKKYITVEIPGTIQNGQITEPEIQHITESLSDIARTFFDKIRCWNTTYMLVILVVFVVVGIITLKLDIRASKALIFGLVYSLLFVLIICGSTAVNKMVLKSRRIAKEKSLDIIGPANETLQSRGYEWYLPLSYPLWIELRKNEPQQFVGLNVVPQIQTVSLEHSTAFPQFRNPILNYNAAVYQSNVYGEAQPLTFGNQPE